MDGEAVAAARLRADNPACAHKEVPMMIRKCMTVLIALMLCAAAIPAWGQPPRTGEGNIKVGPVEVHPSVGITQTWTDNVYRSYDGKDKESDWITTISPGLELILPLRSHSLKVGYFADIHQYKDFNENDYTRQLFTTSLNLDFPGGLEVTVENDYIDSEVRRKWREQAGLSGVADPYRARPYASNDFLTKMRYSFTDRWAAAAWYNYYKYDYDHEYDSTGSFNRHLGGGSIFYRVAPKTELLAEYFHSKVDYPKNPADDNTNDTVYLGIQFDPTAKLSGNLKAGWSQKKYDTPKVGTEDTFDGFSTRIDLDYSLSSYDMIRLKGSRTIEEDIDTNDAYTRDDYSIGYSHILSMNEKIRLNASVGYGRDRYKGLDTDTDSVFKQRKDDICYTTLSVDYAMQRWLMWTLSYSYIDRDSNFIRYDGAENAVFLNGRVSF